MKRIWFAIIFLAIAIISCSYEQIVIKSGYKEISTVIEKAFVSEQADEKVKYCNEIADLWEDYKKKLALVSDHASFEDASVCISQIKSYANQNDGGIFEDVNEALLEAKSQLEQTYNSSKINLSNIF